MHPVIVLESISKIYRSGEVEVHAVREVSLEVQPGEFIAIMGASGSGKSTMMNTLGCLDRPTRGRYLLDGVDVSALNRDELADIRNQKIGFIFQGFNLLSRTSALENVELPMMYGGHRLPAKELRQRAMKALELVGLANRFDHTSNQLSGGQQQRVAIARALVDQPALLLADEPTGNLDSRTSIEIMDAFQSLNEKGITIAMVTHEPDIARYTKRNVVMRDGVIVSDTVVADRNNAKEEMQRLDAELQAAKLVEMKITATFGIAVRALRRNKMRSILTMLGIIIGVGAVIAMVGVGNGAKADVEAQIATLGKNMILVTAGNYTTGGVKGGWAAAGTMKIDDAEAILREISGVTMVSPEVRSGTQIAAGNQNWYTTIIGESPDYFDMRQWEFTSGGSFTEQDIRSSNKVAVIGQTAAQQIFGEEDPVGQIIRVKNVPFLITGLLKAKGFSLGGSDQDDVIVVPYTTAMKRVIGVTVLRGINVQAADDKTMPLLEEQISSLLRQRHNIRTGHDDDFVVRSQQDLAEVFTAQSKTMTILLGSIASVSLIVGGIGIMNIMLVSVTERTREIGIRMAVGAHGWDILLQFLIEAVTLSSLGGLIGIAIGFGTEKAISYFVHWPTVVPVIWVIASFLFSAAIGIFFGLYPAKKAAALDPIDALRYE